jgi:hypothetical protein
MLLRRKQTEASDAKKPVNTEGKHLYVFECGELCLFGKCVTDKGCSIFMKNMTSGEMYHHLTRLYFQDVNSRASPRMVTGPDSNITWVSEIKSFEPLERGEFWTNNEDVMIYEKDEFRELLRLLRFTKFVRVGFGGKIIEQREISKDAPIRQYLMSFDKWSTRKVEPGSSALPGRGNVIRKQITISPDPARRDDGCMVGIPPWDSRRIFDNIFTGVPDCNDKYEYEDEYTQNDEYNEDGTVNCEYSLVLKGLTNWELQLVFGYIRSTTLRFCEICIFEPKAWDDVTMLREIMNHPHFQHLWVVDHSFTMKQTIELRPPLASRNFFAITYHTDRSDVFARDLFKQVHWPLNKIRLELDFWDERDNNLVLDAKDLDDLKLEIHTEEPLSKNTLKCMSSMVRKPEPKPPKAAAESNKTKKARTDA